MDHYHIWFNLRHGTKDLDIVEAIDGLLGHMRDERMLEGWNLSRRKLGFGPPELPEFHLDIQVRDMAQLQAAFDEVTPRSGKVEKLHAAVWSRVTDFKAGLWRDFPDENRHR